MWFIKCVLSQPFNTWTQLCIFSALESEAKLFLPIIFPVLNVKPSGDETIIPKVL